MSESSTQRSMTLNIDWPTLIAKGENPNGFTAWTPNGTSKDKGPGWNRQHNYEMPQGQPTGLWGPAHLNIDGILETGKQSNQTGQ
ncbi:MAG: hypothetical protein KGL39_48565 [Patescibacteria group bacterium]|nr:hypothetical protein [Patescibacteria group bacterium]